jgi:uncharacterized protein (DUF488 family)
MRGELNVNVLYTIGFTKKSAQQFFALLKDNGVTLVADIRLNNRSQLAGFAKAGDLPYFLSLHGIKYVHWVDLAPSAELRALHGAGDHEGYETAYRALIGRRAAIKGLPEGIFSKERVCLLCAEAKPDRCHRRITSELIQAANPGLEIRHL